MGYPTHLGFGSKGSVPFIPSSLLTSRKPLSRPRGTTTATAYNSRWHALRVLASTPEIDSSTAGLKSQFFCHHPNVDTKEEPHNNNISSTSKENTDGVYLTDSPKNIDHSIQTKNKTRFYVNTRCFSSHGRRHKGIYIYKRAKSGRF